MTLRRVYRVIPDEGAAARKMIKLVDDMEGEYWFPARAFMSVEVPQEGEPSFGLAAA